MLARSPRPPLEISNCARGRRVSREGERLTYKCWGWRCSAAPLGSSHVPAGLHSKDAHVFRPRTLLAGFNPLSVLALTPLHCASGRAHAILVNSEFTAGVFARTFKRLGHLKPAVLYPAVDVAHFLSVPPPPSLSTAGSNAADPRTTSEEMAPDIPHGW